MNRAAFAIRGREVRRDTRVIKVSTRTTGNLAEAPDAGIGGINGLAQLARKTGEVESLARPSRFFEIGMHVSARQAPCGFNSNSLVLQ